MSVPDPHVAPLTGVAGTDLPRVIVPYDAGAFPPLDIAQAAQGLCGLVWLTGWPGAQRSPLERLLARLGEQIDVSGLTTSEIVDRLRPVHADGIAVFCDPALEPAAAIAEALELDFHSHDTAARLRDKYLQRAALARAGLSVPGTRVLHASDIASRADANALRAAWPSVLKPRRGTAATNTFTIAGPDELFATLREMPADVEFVLEDFLVDRPEDRRGRKAGLFSVELLVDHGVSEVIALTGRFPLAPPLRETGSFLPVDLGVADTDAAVATARAAATALGVERGILHVEQKITPEGPRIIEVNGRVGGLIPTLLQRIGGAPILRLALTLALGRPAGPVTPVPADGPVAFYRAWLPPVGDSRLTAASGLPAIAARPEIDHAWANLQVGEVVSSREGGGVVGYAAAAFGAAAGHAALWPLCDELDRAVSLTFEPLVGLGEQVAGAGLEAPAGAR